ncbi:uncharacterized protein LOC144179496 isoform X4 [Haemaphysalis longicornis]
MGQCCIRTGVWESSKPGGRTVWGRRLATGRRMGAKEEQGWQPCPLRVEPRPAQGQHAQGSHSGQPGGFAGGQGGAHGPEAAAPRLPRGGGSASRGGGALLAGGLLPHDPQRHRGRGAQPHRPGLARRPVKEPEASPAPVVQGTFPGSWLCTSVDISDVGQQWRPASAP